jgi:hypothetical protein
VLLYGRARRLTAKNGGFGPGQDRGSDARLRLSEPERGG